MSLVGTQLGRLRIVQSLGDGGMGEVYVGFDEVLERRVAVKILRPEHRLEPETRSRFLREARILSQLQHPNICQLHDYLEREEGDVLVLELVEGKTLKEILKQGALDPRRRVAVAQQLADALVVAHERGVVHRDLKPGNIMVTSEGVLKVLDFGLARSVDEEQQTLTLGAAPGTAAPASLGPSSGTDSGRASAVRTQLGRVLGTPAYMAPEQARGEPVTAASDMYALGLLLQEIYTGRAVHEASLTVEQVLERARTADSSLPERVDRDLAALIGRLKSGVPAARPSARDTAERLRWIHRKGARRARRLAVSGAFALLVATIAVVSYQARRIGREAERANREAATAERVSEFLIGLFENADPDRRGGQVVDVLELLDAGARELRTGLEDEPIVRARMMESVGRVYLAMGRPADAADLFERSLALRDAALPDDDPAIARTVGLLSRAYRYLGRFDEALALADRELALCTARDDRLCMSDALDHQSIVYWSQGVLGRAADLSERAAAMAEEAGAPALVVATKLVNLAGSYYMMGRTSECIPVLERALEMEERELGRRHSRVANTLMNLGAIHATLGRLESADRLYREALAIQEGIHGAVHPEVALTTSNLGELALWQGRLLEAENLLRRAVATYETTLGLDHPDLLFPLATLARVYHLQGHAVEAAEAYQRALDVSRDLDDASPTKIALQEQVAAFRAGRDTLLYPHANIRPPLADAVREGDASANAATAERESGAPQR